MNSIFADKLKPNIKTASAAWDVAATALYLRPSLGGYVLPNSLVPTSSTSNQFASTTNDYANWSPGWGWGYKLDGSYHFNPENDLTLSGYHIANTTNYAVPLIINSGGIIGLTGSGTSSVSYNWNAMNVEFGQILRYRPYKSFRFHGGLAYARVATDTRMNINVFPAAPIPLSRNLKGTFNGFGPRIGVDAVYGWNNHFNLYSNVAMALYIGSKGFSDSIYLGENSNPAFAGYENALIHIASVSSIAYGLEAKLGARYTYEMTKSALSIDGGWMCTSYVNALEYRLLLSTTNTATREANFAIQGPYVGLKWLGNVA